MSFITKIGQDTQKDQKLVMLRRKYFRNILQFNQGWQQEKKQEKVKSIVQEQNYFTRLANKQIEALQIEKQKLWNKKMNNQDVLKQGYEKQIHDRIQKQRQEREKDKEYPRLQQLENDKLCDRRMLDLLKIYDRKAVKHSSHRRIKTQPQDSLDNPEISNLLQKPQRFRQIYQKQESRAIPQVERSFFNNQRILNDSVENPRPTQRPINNVNKPELVHQKESQNLHHQSRKPPSRHMQLPSIEQPKILYAGSPANRLQSRHNGSRSVKYLPPRPIF